MFESKLSGMHSNKTPHSQNLVSRRMSMFRDTMKTYNDPERVERQHLCYFTKTEERVMAKHTVLVLNLYRF